MEPNLAGAGHEAIGHEALGVYLGRDARSSALVGMALLGPRRAAVSEAEGGAGGEGGKGGEGVRSNPSPSPSPSPNPSPNPNQGAVSRLLARLLGLPTDRDAWPATCVKVSAWFTL